ncbi:MAG: hypothetical protein CMI16_02820 [Opitutaceae bacterium]|nr:hypothetical protein [Opitutaceae bacterium]
MLPFLTDDLIVNICAAVDISVVYGVTGMAQAVALTLLRGVSKTLRETARRVVPDADLLKLANAVDASRKKRRARLASYLSTMRLRSAMPHLWDGKHPEEIVTCVAECPCAAKNALRQHIDAFARTRRFELLGRYVSACSGLIVSGLLLGFGSTGYNRGAQLDLLRWFERWLSALEKCSILDAVKDHEALLCRVRTELRMEREENQPGKRKLPISFSSSGSKAMYLRRYVTSVSNDS